MEQQNLLMELEEALGLLWDGLDAFKLMTFGLEDIQAPHADGFYAIWRYLDEAGGEVRRLLAEVSAARTAA